eukprot:NODE_5646_length_561_cov_47.435547_g4911_i0.p1 GENE.NODE_5646_length_561_cov_47.435547_g4911_i0~~NODE_5646_length_561_cov_47.435547_g4911_i0.p1  ORF type:complete len:137 (-),score=20.82 NODE_5646_length_561_cov_47.435547_g4911_i0:149-532(-)
MGDQAQIHFWWDIGGQCAVVWGTTISRCWLGAPVNCSADSVPAAAEVDTNPWQRALSVISILDRELQMNSDVVGQSYNYPSMLTANFGLQYFGSNYSRLLSIKKMYDPDQVFRAQQSVGSENYYFSG